MSTKFFVPHSGTASRYYTDTAAFIIYCDCNSVKNYINGSRIKFAAPIKYIAEELDVCISRHSSVQAFHPSDATHLPKYLSAIAHNASAMASGAEKREKTTPEYTGQFSSNESNLLTRKAFHKAANQTRQRQKKRRMAPSL